MKHAAALVILTLCLGAAACRGESDGETTLDGMTFEEVRVRVERALLPTGAVMRTRGIYEQYPEDPLPPPEESWRNLDGGEGRIGGALDPTPVIIRDGKRFEITAAGLLSTIDAPSLQAAHGHYSPVSRMVNTVRSEVRMRRADIDGVAVIRIKLRGQGVDSVVDPSYLYVSADDFLPLRYETSGVRIRFEHELVARNSLPADFFSPDILLAVAAQTPSPPEVWRQQGHTPYWLGATFAGLLPLAGGAPRANDPTASFSFGYGALSDQTSINTCITILHRTDLVPPLPFPVDQRTSVSAQIGDVSIYEGETEWGAWHRLAAGGIVNVIVACDGSGPAPLRSLEGMTLVAEALREYDGPAHLIDLIALSTPTP